MLSIDLMDMISLRPELSLQQVRLKDQEKLFLLMMKIYRPVYQHLWFDDGSSYVESQFNAQQLQNELSSPNASYYFVLHREEPIGILRFLKDTTTSAIKETNTTKLHRIYLDPSVHGQGIGKALMHWLIEFSITQDQQSIWLECMDTQMAAYHFYKQLGFTTVESFTLDSPTMRSERRGMLRMKMNLNNS
jgi:ribosomal protein S18 acetylase RimI-like enzyme